MAAGRSSQTESHLEVIPTGTGQARRLERPGLRLRRGRWLADGRQVVVRASANNSAPRLYLLDVEGTATRPITPEGLAIGDCGMVGSPDGTMVAVSTGERLELFPIAGGTSRSVPGGLERWTVLSWIESGLLVSEDPLSVGIVVRVDPATGRRETWADIRPQDPAGIMSWVSARSS